jgi:hypothetical protein
MRLCYECGVLSSLSSFCHVESGGYFSQEPSLSTFWMTTSELLVMRSDVAI